MEIVPRIWFFEGLDKSGKTTLCRACRFSSGHAMPMYDRGPVSRQLFIQYHREKAELFDMWLEVELKLHGSGLYGIVHCVADIPTIRERMRCAGETPQTEEDLDEQKNILDILLDQRRSAGVPVVRVETGHGGGPEECVRGVLAAMKLPFIKFDRGVSA